MGQGTETGAPRVVASAVFALIRYWRAKLLAVFFHHPGEGTENRYYGGSTRRFRPHPALACHLPHPGEGFFRLCESFLFYFLIQPMNRHCLYVSRNHRSSLPPGGGRKTASSLARQRRMRAKQASVAQNAPHHPVSVPPVGGGRCAVRSSNGDPACWRPARGAGFDCAALFGCRVRPYTRCAASLRMTRGGQGRGTKYVRCKI